jgi:hypothetical protein
MAAFRPSSNGQQSGRSGEQPTSGNSVTSPRLSVIMAKCGTVQLPVIKGAPAKPVAVNCFAVVAGAVSEMTSPVRVETLGLTEPDEVDAETGEAVEAVPPAGARVRLMLARALDKPAGEQPTKSGAVSLTFAHSSLLNWIAAGCGQFETYDVGKARTNLFAHPRCRRCTGNKIVKRRRWNLRKDRRYRSLNKMFGSRSNWIDIVAGCTSVGGSELDLGVLTAQRGSCCTPIAWTSERYTNCSRTTMNVMAPAVEA